MTDIPRRMATAAVCAGLLALGGCMSTSSSGTQSEPRGSEASVSPTHQPHHPTSSQSPTVSKVLVFVVENHSLDQMRAQMPYTFSLAERYGYTTSYHALTHPSLGNYLAIAGGSTFGVVDDSGPAVHPIHGPSVFSQARSAGDTAATYAEGMPGNCALDDGGDQYVVRHNPWTYFVGGRAACDRFDVPGDQLYSAAESGRLPNIGLVIPNTCNDAHDCALAIADDWLHKTMEKVLAGPDWRSGHLAIVITADEDDYNADNLVLTTVVHPGLHHVVVDAPLTHLSLSAFLSEVVHRPPLRQAAHAPSLGDAFGLRVSP